MAKAAPSIAPPSPRSPANKRSEGEIIERLKLYHSVGREANADARAGDGRMPSQLTIERFARLYGMTEVTLRKARSFAREYTETDLERLCKLRRPNGQPLNWGLIPYLLTVKGKRLRRRLEKQAAEHGWDAIQLFAEIRRHRPKPMRSGGRPLKRHASDAEAFAHLVAEARRWSERSKMVQSVPKRLRQDVRRKAIDVLERLKQDVQRLIAQLLTGDRPKKNGRRPR